MLPPLLIVLLALFVVSLLGGGLMYKTYGGWGMSPAIVILTVLVILIILYASGTFVTL